MRATKEEKIYIKSLNILKLETYSKRNKIVKNRDLDFKLPNDAANKIILKKETQQVICRGLPIIMRTSPIDFALLCRKRKYTKPKTTSKLKYNLPGCSP
jgi:hypothetical protein